MDLIKGYTDSGGLTGNILQVIKREPEWAANRIQEGEKAESRVRELEEKNKNLKEWLKDSEHKVYCIWRASHLNIAKCTCGLDELLKEGE